MKEISHQSKNHIIHIKPWEIRTLIYFFDKRSRDDRTSWRSRERKEQVLKRHKRYLELGSKGCMFSITLLPELEAVGSVGYWQTIWNEESMYEIGWRPIFKDGLYWIYVNVFILKRLYPSRRFPAFS